MNDLNDCLVNIFYIPKYHSLTDTFALNIVYYSYKRKRYNGPRLSCRVTNFQNTLNETSSS